MQLMKYISAMVFGLCLILSLTQIDYSKTANVILVCMMLTSLCVCITVSFCEWEVQQVKNEKTEMGKCDTCKANKVCDHDKFGFENCGNYIKTDGINDIPEK